MKIHYNKEFNCFETTERHKTDSIELDGVKLIPITELEKIKKEVSTLGFRYPTTNSGLIESTIIDGILDYHIKELKGESE